MQSLTHSPADILRYALVALGIGVRPSLGGEWPIFEGKEPDDPDNCITLRNVSGQILDRIQFDGDVGEYPGVQIRVRSVGEITGYAKIEEVRAAVDSLYNLLVTIEAHTYTLQSANRNSGVIHINNDSPSSKRHIHTLTVTVTVVQNS